jgi:hypothetical protein
MDVSIIGSHIRIECSNAPFTLMCPVAQFGFASHEQKDSVLLVFCVCGNRVERRWTGEGCSSAQKEFEAKVTRVIQEYYSKKEAEIQAKTPKEHSPKKIPVYPGGHAAASGGGSAPSHPFVDVE